MTKGKGILWLFLMVIGASLFLPIAHAKGARYSSSHGSSQGWGLEEKFLHKAYMILQNEDELGLTDEQVQKIKDLKLTTKKEVIKQSAEIEVIGLDLDSKLKDQTVDLEVVNALIDQKYELKKAKTKQLAAAYAALKSTLTEDQYDSLKEIWKKKSF